MGVILTLEEMNGYVRIDEIGGLRLYGRKEESQHSDCYVKLYLCWSLDYQLDF